MTDFYIVNVSHTSRDQKYISFWRPDNKGYAYPLSWSGVYTEACVREHLDYYNSGENIAVPCSVVNPLARAPLPGEIDNDAGPVVPSNSPTWRLLLKNAIALPKHKPKPQYPYARKLQKKGHP